MENIDTYIANDIITEGDTNPMVSSPKDGIAIQFYQTKESLIDPDVYRRFIKNAEARFRATKEYKSYKAYLMSLGLDHCQILGNIEADKGVDIELHHNILSLFDDTVMICEHVLNTSGYISTFDLIQLLIQEHYANRIPCTFLSKTIHEYYTNNPNAYISPEQTFGKWWELIAKYRFGITYDIAEKLIKYITKFQNNIPTNIIIPKQEEILSFAYYNQYGMPADQMKLIPDTMPQKQQRIEENEYYDY